MFVLHAGIIHGQVYLWGEIRRESKDIPRVGGKRTPGRTRPLPFGANSEELLQAIETLSKGRQTGFELTEKVLAWLPSQGQKPLASSPLIADAPDFSSGTGEGWLTELSNDELKDLLVLRKEAVQE